LYDFAERSSKELGFAENKFADLVVKDYRNGRDLLAKSRVVMVIDLLGFDEAQVREKSPRIYQYLRDSVWPDGKDKNISEQGLIGILRDLHDQIDTAVADAYGWPADLSDEDILFRLVALNKERADEEAR